MEDIDLVIRGLMESVAYNDLEAAKQILDVLDPQTCDPEDELFMTLMEIAVAENAEACIQEIMVRWDYDDAVVSLVTRLFLMPRITVEQISKILSLFEGQDYGSIMVDLISQPSTDKLEIACKRLDELFGEQQPEVYKALLDYIEKDLEAGGAGTYVVQKILERNLAEVNQYAPKPKYVQDYLGDAVDERVAEGEEAIARGVNGLPLERELLETQSIESLPSFNLPSPEEVATLILKGGMTPMRFFAEEREVRDLIASAYSLLTREEKVAALAPLYKHNASIDTNHDLSLYRLLGPVTIHSGLLLDRDDPCSIYGGCRMLVCLEYENTDRERGIVTDDPYAPGSEVVWFTGVCASCQKKIRKPCHAVRRPILTGGWIGCYCSWNCVRDGAPEGRPHNTDLAGRNERLPNLIFDRYIDQLEKTMNDNGIQDRDYGDGEMEYTGHYIMGIIEDREEESD